MDGPAQANDAISKSDTFDDNSAKYGPIIIIMITMMIMIMIMIIIILTSCF